MIKIFATFVEDCDRMLESVLLRHIPAQIEILRTENGKPYIDGNPVFFSISDSGERAVIALSDRPVGIDLEVFKNKERLSVVSRFTEREQAEICCERDFLIHWTAREAYIKLYGLTLAKMLKRIEFCDGILSIDGRPQNVKFSFYNFGYGIAAICTEK